MHVPPELYKNLRGILAICILLAGVFVWLMWRDTQPRDSYSHVTGKLTYVGKRLGDKPLRDFEKYRYVKIDGLAYPIEFYADEQAPRMDSLKVGDVVTAWYILVDDDSWPGGKGINPRYLYKGSKPVYVNDGTVAIQIGSVVIGLLFCTCWFSYAMYRKGKIKW